jgi:hypothetical protein
MKKWYPWFGIAAPIVYTAAAITGGFMINGYSHVYNTISELTATNAPKIPLIQILFSLYNLLLIFFGIGTCVYLDTPRRKKTQAAAFMLAGIGILGLGMYFYPQEPRNMAMTFTGIMHIILASMASLFTMIAVMLAGSSFKSDSKLNHFRIYSYLTFAFIFITGGLAAANVANNSAFGGLFERLTIGAFMLWVLVVAIAIRSIRIFRS